MKHECSIVRDLLPLYAEGMLSQESTAFVKEHLESCDDCRAAYHGEETPAGGVPADTAKERSEEVGVLRTLKRKLRKQTWCIIAITAAVVLLVTLMLRLNPIDYLAAISSNERYTFSDRMALLFKGGYSDQDAAEAVLSNVHIVFQYSEEEIYNDVLAMSREDAAYAMGALVWYCVPERYAGKVLTITLTCCRHISAGAPGKCGSNTGISALIRPMISRHAAARAQ